MPKTFLLGVGAQKAGTSWLHDQLHRRADADFGFLKEYHVLDALTLDSFKSFRPHQPPPWRWRTWRRYRFLKQSDRYFDYFDDLLKKPKIKLTGDITPSYGCLSAETLRWVREQFHERDIATKVVFILRDPVERVLSQQRIKLRKIGKLEPEHEIEHLRKAARKLLKKPSKRSDYSKTIKTLYASFKRDDVLIELYEQLFNEVIFKRLCNHLNIDYLPPDWNQRINESSATISTPDDILELIGISQSNTFRSLISLCPELNLKERWPTASRWCV